jgi:hypothetical protein
MGQVKKTKKYHDPAGAQRLRHLRIVLGFEQAKQFAEWLGVEEDRWGNVERGYPISGALIRVLCQKIPGLTADWLLFGKPGGMPWDTAKWLLKDWQKYP